MIIFFQEQHYIFLLEFQEEAKFSSEPVSKQSTSPRLQTITDNSHSEVQEKRYMVLGTYMFMHVKLFQIFNKLV